MSRSLLLAVCLLLIPATASAALDPEAGKPYHLRVVLRIEKHRLLTDLFKDEIERELRGGLQAALSDMARVEVVRDHPRLKEVEEKGLEALDGWKELSEIKTHFVLIDFISGSYEVRARQHDGLTGQASPIVRRERVADRRFVARMALLLIDLDFGLVGTVTDKGDGQTVRIEIKGGKLGVSLERWVRKGEVFALVQINQGSAGLRAYRRPWAVLQVEEPPRDGSVVCRLYHRHPDPLAMAPGVLGYRAIKLGTTIAPLRLRFVEGDARGLTPRPNLQVHVRRQGFQGEETTREQGTSDADGFFQAGRDKPYEHLAFVNILDGGQVRAQIPVTIVDDRPIEIPFSAKAEAGAPLLIRRNLWRQRLYESLLAQAGLFKELSELAAKPEGRQRSLDKARASLKGLSADIDIASQELNQLRAAAKELPGGDKVELADGEQRLQELRKGRQELEQFAAGLEKVIKEESDPRRMEILAKIERARRLLENDAEFGQAIAVYQEVLKEAEAAKFKLPEVEKRLQKLQEGWQVKGPRHEQARIFAYEAWPKLTLDGLKTRLPEARIALDEFRKAGDTLSPQRLLKAAVAHVARLNEQEARLQPATNPDHAKQAEAIAEMREGLGKLIQEVNAYLEQAAK